MSTSTASPIRAAFPSGPIADENGNVTAVWRGYFQSLYVRTGSAPGASTPNLGVAIAAESVVRSSTDTGLSNAIAAERTARENADLTEAATRAAADNTKMPYAGGTFTGAIYGPTAGFNVFQQGSIAGGPTWTSGYGAPASTQPLGSIYSRRDGAVGTTIYVSRGTGTWNAIAGV
jgi:hypothetical protein